MADLDQLVADCLEALENGDWTSIDAICAAHPEHADTIRKRVQRIAGMGLVGNAEVPERIGPYRILDRLGHGGMGSVYLAEQREPVRRKVALKVIKLGMDTREVIRRFEAERQALALMSHANIARVFDAGRTEEGRPYFAMEYVPGVPITDYCDKHRLTTRERVRLMLPVCDAIQHAHHKGIIHRDLKPSNVIVGTGDDGTPTPKVIDFGVAKATHGALTDGTLHTAHGQLVGTPEYMSPEQASWQPHDLDARTDVYALGTVLYELLSASLPFDAKRLRSANPAEMFRIIQEEAAPPLSTTLEDDEHTARAADSRSCDPRMLKRELRGDLDWIARRALEKDRKRRYQTPLQLGDDLARFLAHEPVHARPPSRSYQLTKFVRKHRVVVGASALIFAALIAGVVTTTVAMMRANDFAEREASARADLEDSRQRYRLVATVPMLAQANAEARKISPAWPQHVGALERWLRELATPLAQRHPEIERAIEDMRAQHGPGIANDDPKIDRAERWLFARLQRARADLDAFFGDKGNESFVRARLAWAREIRERSIDAHGKAWRATIDAVRSDARYNLVLEPQVGLVPLGRDPESGLFEFAHLRSGRPPLRDPKTRQLQIDESTGIVFVLVPAGTFAMGSQTKSPKQPNFVPGAAHWESPVHRVGLPVAFFLSKHEVNQAQWARLSDGERPSFYTPGRLDPAHTARGVKIDDEMRKKAGLVVDDTHPVENISWRDCVELFALHGLSLPTEAQWEYACRAGTSSRWATGDSIASLEGCANFADLNAALLRDTKSDFAWIPYGDGYAGPAPTHSMKANGWGFHHMHGNVWEWCLDGFLRYAHRVEGDNSLRDDRGVKETRRVQRGGSFAVGPSLGRSAMRWSRGPGVRHASFGVRAARPLLRAGRAR